MGTELLRTPMECWLGKPIKVGSSIRQAHPWETLGAIHMVEMSALQTLKGVCRALVEARTIAERDAIALVFVETFTEKAKHNSSSKTSLGAGERGIDTREAETRS